MKKALVTGITGQDGSYLADLLLEKKYKVYGLVRRSSAANLWRIEHLIANPDLVLVEGEMSDPLSVYSIIEEYRPDEIYNMAAMSHVHTSFKQPVYTFQADTLGPLNLLEAIKKYVPDARVCQASTSEMFGSNYDTDSEGRKYQDENTCFSPQSPYAVSKLAAHHLFRIYRTAHNLHVSCGILFNHESPRRGDKFVTQKIIKWLGSYVRWRQLNFPSTISFEEENIRVGDDTFPKLRLGNLDAYRDWGHAKDYVWAYWLMLQQDVPDDYVIATGETHTVREFLREAFNCAGIPNYEDYIVIDPKFYRPAEVDFLCGRPDKAHSVLGWHPQYSFFDLVNDMISAELPSETKKTIHDQGLRSKEVAQKL